MIGVITHNRLALLQASLDSLRRSRPSDVLIFDDASNAETTNSLLGRWPVRRNPERLGADQNTYQMCDYLAERYNHFIISGSDVLYAEGFEARLENLYAKYSHLGVAMVGGFLGTNHRQGTFNFMGNCLLVETLTGPCLVSSKFWRANRIHIDPNECDVSMCRVANAQGWRMLCVKNSICQHIGIRDGLHAKEGDTPDLAVRFIGKDGSLRYDQKRPPSASIFEIWSHGPDETRLVLWSDGTCDFGTDFGTWRLDGSMLRVRDSVWTTEVLITGDTYSGKAFPNGADMVWFEVNGKRL